MVQQPSFCSELDLLWLTPVPEGSQTPPPSGRPALDDAKCESVWKMAAPSGGTLDKDKAVPFVVNFQMVRLVPAGMESLIESMQADDFGVQGCIN